MAPIGHGTFDRVSDRRHPADYMRHIDRMWKFPHSTCGGQHPRHGRGPNGRLKPGFTVDARRIAITDFLAGG